MRKALLTLEALCIFGAICVCAPILLGFYVVQRVRGRIP